MPEAGDVRENVPGDVISPGALDVFGCGLYRFALPAGQVRRVGYYRKTLPVTSEDAPLVYLAPVLGDDPPLVLMGDSKVPLLALDVRWSAGILTMLVNRVIFTTSVPERWIPISFQNQRFCGISFITAMALWPEEIAWVIDLTHLIAFFQSRRHECSRMATTNLDV